MEIKLYTPHEVANMLGLKPSTIRRWLNTGYMPGVKLNGVWRIRHQEFWDFIVKAVPPNSEEKSK